MPRGIQPKGIARRNKMLRAAIQLFLFQGYEKTTTASIARSAGFTPSSFFAAFENKEALLLTLTKRMFADQFTLTEEAFASRNDPLLLYGVETALQLHIAELNPALRELYVTAYSLPSTSEFIYRSMTENCLSFLAPICPRPVHRIFMSWRLLPPVSLGGIWPRPVGRTSPWSKSCGGIWAAASPFMAYQKTGSSP